MLCHFLFFRPIPRNDFHEEPFFCGQYGGSLVVSLAGKVGFYSLSYLLTLFGFLTHCVFRLKGYLTPKKNSSSMLIQTQDDHQIIENMSEEKNDDFRGENDKSESFLMFRFSTYEEFAKNNRELVKFEAVQSAKEEDVLCDKSNDESLSNESKDDVPLTANSIDFVQPGETVGCPNISSETESCRFKTVANYVNESFQDVNIPLEDSPEISAEPEVSQRIPTNDHIVGDLGQQSEEFIVKNKEQPGPLVDNTDDLEQFLHVEDVTEEDNPRISLEAEDFQSIPINDLVSGNVGESSKEMEVNEEQPSEFVNDLTNIARFPGDDDDDDESLVTDSDSDSMVSSTKSCFKSSFIDSICDGFLSDIDYEGAFEVDASKEFDEVEVKSSKEFSRKEHIELQNLVKGYETNGFELENEDKLDELKNLEGSNLDSNKVLLEQQNGVNVESKTESNHNAKKPKRGEQLPSYSDEQKELERQWEHQELVEQLKIEIRKLRALGLPTILEESESPKLAEDLKPWNIEEKFEYEDTMDEVHKFYKNYSERMRKLDILNYQKMYAIGFLQLKDQLHSFSTQRISFQAMATIASLNCWPLKLKSVKELDQPVMKLSRELESDLEMVYVGQMCLSWEFLRWEYRKALELWESDPHGIRQYSEVAEKFQQFQVHLTRFIEDERFQGPRVQDYVKNRCVHQNLLQVPVIREDTPRDRKVERGMMSSKDAITSVKLVEMIEDTIRIFWHFIRTDNDTSKAVLKCRWGSNVELQNPGDADLFAHVRSSLQKKEKKLRELTRSKKCVLRKLQTQQEDISDPVLYFFSQVDLKLVQRVLNMSKTTTEQLIWCSDKLSKINFAGRKLLVEPSVLFFHCP